MASKGRLLVVDDEMSLRLLLKNELTRAGYSVDVACNGEEALTMLLGEFYLVILLDIVMPGLDGVSVLKKIKAEHTDNQVIVLTGNASIESAIECMKFGAFEYIRKPYALNELLIQIERAIEHQQTLIDRQILRNDLVRSGYSGQIIGKSKKMQDLRKMIGKIAQTQSTVLIQGESGTGKELVARAIHDESLNRERHFVPINCASLSEQLLESELFGYEKGAFTDAKTQKRGLAEIADNGTLFLDEIGEIPMHFQAKLLRFLETGEIRRVGGTRDIALNVRIICATNKRLEQLLETNEFRSDLYYRLNVLSIVVPPLRDHSGDISELVESFIRMQGPQKRFVDQAMQVLINYPWPGNVRELKNVVERTCVLSKEIDVTEDDLSFLNSHSSEKPKAVPNIESEASYQLISLADLERQHIVAILKHVGGHRGKAAEILQVNPKTLYHKIRAYNIVSSFA